jgi:hypothetical protein
MPDSADLIKLRQILTDHFDDGELRTLCFDLRIDYQSLPGEGKADRARELIAHCQRHGRMADLIDRCGQLRPNVAWPDATELPYEFPPIPSTGSAERHNALPHQPYFFGREDELGRIADALDPEAAGWGVLIDGAGGIGKTALAIRAGQLASDQVFPIKIFLSAKTRELLPHGEQKLDDYQLPNFVALLAELARELGEDEIAKMNPNERANELRRALADRHALIIIDNLETLEEQERERLFQFLRRLPRSCKAIVTSRRRTDVAAEIIRLDRLTPEAAHALIAKIAERNPALARASDAERQQLYETAGGNPLLIEWLAGQLGRPGSRCRTVADACAFMQAAPPGNDPLEYIFGDLLDTFTESETAVLAALSHFTLPAKTKWIAEMTNLSLPAAQTALEDLTDRALVVADTQFKTFLLPPLAAVFLRRKRPEIIAQTGERLTDRVLALVLENGGFGDYEGLPILEAEWPMIAAALPMFIQGDSARLQRLCTALYRFLTFSGRWDELMVLSSDAEERAVAANDANSAGWRAYAVGYVYRQRNQAHEVLACARRTEAYWSSAGAREKGCAFQLYAWGYRLEKNYFAAIVALRKALDLWCTLAPESHEVAIGLRSLAGIERDSGDYAAAEAMAREAMPLLEVAGQLEIVARDCRILVQALAQQRRAAEGLPYAQRAVEIFAKLRHRDLAEAQAVLKECEGSG